MREYRLEGKLLCAACAVRGSYYKFNLRSEANKLDVLFSPILSIRTGIVLKEGNKMGKDEEKLKV